MKHLRVIRYSDFEKLGCPICGYNKGQEHSKGPSWIQFECGQCQTQAFLLATGLTETPFTVGEPPTNIAVQGHLRNGTLAHFEKITDEEKLRSLLFQFENCMVHTTSASTYIKFKNCKTVTKLEENFPHVIPASREITN